MDSKPLYILPQIYVCYTVWDWHFKVFLSILSLWCYITLTIELTENMYIKNVIMYSFSGTRCLLCQSVLGSNVVLVSVLTDIEKKSDKVENLLRWPLRFNLLLLTPPKLLRWIESDLLPFLWLCSVLPKSKWS